MEKPLIALSYYKQIELLVGCPQYLCADCVRCYDLCELTTITKTSQIVFYTRKFTTGITEHNRSETAVCYLQPLPHSSHPLYLSFPPSPL